MGAVLDGGLVCMPARSVTHTVSLRLQNVACGAIQVLYAFTLHVVLLLICFQLLLTHPIGYACMCCSVQSSGFILPALV